MVTVYATPLTEKDRADLQQYMLLIAEVLNHDESGLTPDHYHYREARWDLWLLHDVIANLNRPVQQRANEILDEVQNDLRNEL